MNFLYLRGDCVIDALQTNFLTEQRPIIQANSSEEREGISGWAVVKVIGGVLGIAAGIAAILVTPETLGASLPAGIKMVSGGVLTIGAGIASVVWGVDDTVEGLSGEFDLPMIAYTPFAIFSNMVPVFDINFFNPMDDVQQETEESEQKTYRSSASILQKTVATWYVALRNLAIVGLLSVLLYIGIKIIIGSVSDKAKYKELLIDWLVAICLVFFIHYIMVFIVQITESIGTFFAETCQENIFVDLPKDTKVNGETLESDPEKGNPVWVCNFIGYSRLIAGGFSDYDTIRAIEFTIIYLALIIYTVIFTIMYLKRVLYMAFLTIVAPLIAFMYPIDKMNDGKAQGFDTWIKEYIFNALMQPFHMLIYTIIIGTVMDFVLDYPIYALVALGFLIPAEKLLRKMLGFEKAQTPSNMGALGVAGAGLLMSGINKLTHMPRKAQEEENNIKSGYDNIRMKTDDFDTIGNYGNENRGMLESRNTLLNDRKDTEASSPNNSQEDFSSNSSYLTNNDFEKTGMPNLIEDDFEKTDMPNLIEDDFKKTGMSNLIENDESQKDNINGSTNGYMYENINRDTKGNINDSENRNMYGSTNESTNNSMKDGKSEISRKASQYRGVFSNDDTTQRNNIKKKTLKNRLGNGIMAVGTRYSRKIAKSHPLRSLRKGVTYGLGAASLGMVGLAAGITSGDLGKTVQYTAAAGVVGGKVATGIGDSVSFEIRGNAESFKQGWYGEEYQDKVREKNIKEMQTNPNNVQYLRERTSDYKQILKEAYPEYARYGCTNIEDFWAAYQLEKSGSSRNSAISTYKLAQRIGDVSKSPDVESKWEKKLDEEFEQSPTVKARQKAEKEELEKQYMLLQKEAEEEYKKQRKIIENSKRKNSKEEYKKIQDERNKKLEELKQKHEEKQHNIRIMPNRLTRSALEDVKQFYRNK